MEIDNLENQLDNPIKKLINISKLKPIFSYQDILVYNSEALSSETFEEEFADIIIISPPYLACNRKAVGIEINPEYCELIKSRLIKEEIGEIFYYCKS